MDAKTKKRLQAAGWTFGNAEDFLGKEPGIAGVSQTDQVARAIFNQVGFDIRCEWGANGVAWLAPISDVIVIVDVLSFSTCVSIAAARGAIVFPYQWKDASQAEFARSVKAKLAGLRGKGKYSLSPASLLSIQSGTRLVLPSPNGAALTLATGTIPTLAGCLRNAKAVARAAMQCGRRIAVIPAGERWTTDESLRPAIEDLIGAGAIINYLSGTLSPEARIATAAFQNVKTALSDTLLRCSSGKELAEKGFAEDVAIAAEMNADDCAPRFRESAYSNAVNTIARAAERAGHPVGTKKRRINIRTGINKSL